MSIKNVCVYCGSSNHVDPSYRTLAASTGTRLAQNGIGLVYGGGHVGLMGTVADAALSAGGTVIGIIPHHLHEREIQHTGLTELHVVSDMRTRKRMMEEKSDAFIVLPGGFGTLDEAFEIMTARQIGLHAKPVIVVNINGFWDPLLALIDHIIDTGFAMKETKQIFSVIDSLDGLMDALNAPPQERLDPTKKWQ